MWRVIAAWAGDVDGATVTFESAREGYRMGERQLGVKGLFAPADPLCVAPCQMHLAEGVHLLSVEGPRGVTQATLRLRVDDDDDVRLRYRRGAPAVTVLGAVVGGLGLSTLLSASATGSYDEGVGLSYAAMSGGLGLMLLGGPTLRRVDHDRAQRE